MKGVALVLAWLPLAASAATMTVTSTADNSTAGNGQCTLREAIANVNAAADTTAGDCAAGSGAGDTIKFGLAMPATIKLKLGELLSNHDVSIVNPAPGTLRIDAGGKSRVFEIAAGTTSMSGVTIQHGRADNGGGLMVDSGATSRLVNCGFAGNQAVGVNDYNYQFGDEGYGGAVYNAGTVSLANCRLTGNVVKTFIAGGGAVHNEGGSVTLTNCLLSKNAALVGGDGTALGGAVSTNEGTLVIENCTLVGNKASGPTWAYQLVNAGAGFNNGGALYNEAGTVTVTNSTFSKNRVFAPGDSQTNGGAIFNDGTMTLTGCTLNRNLTLTLDYGESYGGGISNSGVMRLANCTLKDNLALFLSVNDVGYGGGKYGRNSGVSQGGGIYNDNDVTLTNCTLAGNHTRVNSSYGNESGGGAIYSDGAPVSLTNCTLSGNHVDRSLVDGNNGYSGYYAARGGGIAGGASVTNTIIANSGRAANCSEMVSSGGHNLSSDATCFAAGGSDLVRTTPGLAPLADNGGPTQTMALCMKKGGPVGCRRISPAVDAGNDVVTGPPDNLSTDQRGLPRRSGAHVDIGAYEVQ